MSSSNECELLREIKTFNTNFAKLVEILASGGAIMLQQAASVKKESTAPKKYYWDKSPSSISNSFPIYRVFPVTDISEIKSSLSIFDSVSDAIDDAMQHGISVDDIEVEGKDGKTESASKYL